MTFRERLDKLEPKQLSLLQYAFEQQISGQFVELPNNKFIGVNVEHVKNLSIEESVGSWSYGTVNKGE